MKLIYLIICSTIIYSCSKTPKHPENNHNAKEINVNINDQEIKIKEILKSVNYTFLKLDSNSVIGEIDKLLFHNQHFYLLDKKQKTIYVFERSGNFVFKFFKNGYGPGEYNSVNDFTIFNDMICILDTDKILQYSISGKYLNTIYLTFTATKIENIENEYFAFFRHYNLDRAKNINYNLIITDKKGKIIRKYFPYSVEDAINNIATKDVFYNSFNELIYIHRLNDTIYSLSKGFLKPKYSINFDKAKMPINALENNKYLKYPHFLKNFAENKNHVLFSFNYREGIYHVIYDKISQNTICYRYISSDDKFLFKGTPVIAKGERFYSVCESYDYALFFIDMKENYPEEFQNMLNNYQGLDSIYTYIMEGQLNPFISVEEYMLGIIETAETNK